MPKKRVCIISYSPIYRDARVLRQIKYLGEHFDLTVIGYGPRPTEFPQLDYYAVAAQSNLPSKLVKIGALVLGRFVPAIHDLRIRAFKVYRDTLHQAIISNADVFLANDWSALPVSAEAARISDAALVLDEHEFAPAESESLYYRLFFSFMTRHFLKKYLRDLDGFTTVCKPIAERYGKEFGIKPIVVMSAPEPIRLVHHNPVDQKIMLVHHGLASRSRRLELMIETISKAKMQFELHLLLVGNQQYIEELRLMADRIAPGRVFFHEPVAPNEIVEHIMNYDIGFCLIAPSNYNYYVSLPNKFFDYLVAGLPVCIGPSPSMAELVIQYDFGVIAPSFRPEDIAKVLNELDSTKINIMKAAAREASKVLNADVEMAKMVEIVEQASLRRHQVDANSQS